jgi:hypothetical protein
MQELNVKIDETPPSVAFEPAAPSNPTALTVDTRDAQSGVSSGQIQMRPATGTAWTPLQTRFDGQRLTAGFDDASLAGPYVFQATSCDAAGNCSSATKTLTLPVRMASVSNVVFAKVAARAPTRGRRLKRHVVAPADGASLAAAASRTRCSRRRTKVSAHRWRVVKTCHAAAPASKTTERVPFGRIATIEGVLTTARGTPISGAPLRILTAPADGFDSFAQQSVVTTSANGAWSATLPPGPSRFVRAVYDGSPTILPSSGEVREIVPARIRILRISPRHVAWGGTVRLTGWLEGGYLPPPPAGELVRLRLGYGRAYTTYGVKIDVTGNGRFTTNYTFGLGPASLVRRIWFQVQALPQDDYPYHAPADSQRVTVTVGGHPKPRCCGRRTKSAGRHLETSRHRANGWAGGPRPVLGPDAAVPQRSTAKN